VIPTPPNPRACLRLGLVLTIALASCSGAATATLPSADPRLPGTAAQLWTRDGSTVPASVIEMSGGPSHCGWDRLTILDLGWPLGSTWGADDRQCVRDPSRWFGPYQVGPGHSFDPSLIDLHAALPPDAKATGYTSGPVELYLGPTDENNVVYLVGLGRVERWPRIDPPVGCQ
jgi:hypothetical protein